MGRRRGFGEIECRTTSSGRRTYRARYMLPTGARYSRTFANKMTAEAWLTAERRLLDRGEWTTPEARAHAAVTREQAAAANTLAAFGERYLTERDLRPNTLRGYRQLLDGRILPYLGATPLKQITLTEIKAWRATLDPATQATNAAAYRLLRSLLQAAEEEELIDRAPPKIRGAANARVTRVARPATLAEVEVITQAMPERLRLFIVLAAFVGLREGELLELRRSDIDPDTGLVSVSRKIDKDLIAGARGACPNCKRAISAPKTASGIRNVHVPPPFLSALQHHLAEHTAPGPEGLLFPGDRNDHMSVRYLMDRYRPAREAAGRPDLTIHHLRHTALTLAGQHGATAAELQARGGHASQAAMAIYQHGTRDRDKRLADSIGDTYQTWRSQQD